MNNENTGEWQEERNAFGGVRRYRIVGGGVKEYEMMVIIDGIEIPQSQVEDYHRRKKEAEQALKEANEREARLHTSKTCPFKDGLNTECLTDCALYGKTACALTMKETPPDKDTSGGNCPIYRRQCNEKCALYFNGCGLINIVKGLNAGKEN